VGGCLYLSGVCELLDSRSQGDNPDISCTSWNSGKKQIAERGKGHKLFNGWKGPRTEKPSEAVEIGLVEPLIRQQQKRYGVIKNHLTHQEKKGEDG